MAELVKRRTFDQNFKKYFGKKRDFLKNLFSTGVVCGKNV